MIFSSNWGPPPTLLRIPIGPVCAFLLLVLLSMHNCVFALQTSPATGVSDSSSPEKALQQAIEQYTDALETDDRDDRIRKFSRAEQLFRQLIEEYDAAPNESLLLNLGNSALQAEHVGTAIAAYRSALLVSPGNTQASQNLAYARSTVPDWAAYSSDDMLVETLFFWKQIYSTSQIQILAAVAFAVAMGLVAFSIATSRSIWRNLSILPFGIWAVLLASTLLSGSTPDSEAVIVQPDTVLHSADSENSAARISQPLPDGAEVTVIQTRERWTEVQFSGKTGWVRNVALKLLSQ